MLLELVLDELGAGDHEERLPDAESDPGDDAAEQSADAVEAPIGMMRGVSP